MYVAYCCTFFILTSHRIAALILGSLCAAGSVFRIFNTSGFQNDFKRIVVNGSCNGYDILGDSYFQSRRNEEVCNLKPRE